MPADQSPVRTVKPEHLDGFRCIDCGDPLPRFLAFCAALRCVDCEEEYRTFGALRPLNVQRPIRGRRVA